MTKTEFAALLDRIQEEERVVREAGQKEYAHDEDNCFRNFEAAASDLGIEREKVLMVFARKHWDGICAWVNGHKSQREDVRGRIKDLRMYLALLWGMMEEPISIESSPCCSYPDYISALMDAERLSEIHHVHFTVVRKGDRFIVARES